MYGAFTAVWLEIAVWCDDVRYGVTGTLYDSEDMYVICFYVRDGDSYFFLPTSRIASCDMFMLR